MASRPWTAEDRAFLETLAERRYWIEDAMQRFTDRSEAAVRCMMQKVRAELGIGETDLPNAWMVDAQFGSARLYERLIQTGLRP